MCDNRVDQIVPKGWDYKTVSMKCGNTSIHGRTLLCESCNEERARKKMPEPGYCRHGVRISEYDCDCFACEMGYDD